MNSIIIPLMFCYLSVAAENSTFVAKFDSVEKLFAFEGEMVNIRSTLSLSMNNDSLKTEKIVLKCRMDNFLVGITPNWTDIIISMNISENLIKLVFDVTIKAIRLGGSNLVCSLISVNNSVDMYEDQLVKIIVKRRQTVSELIFRILVIIFIIYLTFIMGCGLDIKIIWGYIKTPISPFIGFCSQFIFMPLIAAGLAKFTKIDRAFALGLLVVGCSPGGGASNIWTILFGGDLNLSMTMTFVSTCAALGMMPLWLFILSGLFIDQKNNIIIPYGNIILNILQLVIPAILGIVFRWKWEDKAAWLIQRLKLMALFFLIFVYTYGIYANLYIFTIYRDYPYLIPIGALLPWLGFIFGFILAWITRRNKAQIIAIILETGCQNIGIAILISKYSLPQPDGDLSMAMPVMIGMLTPIPLFIVLGIMMIKIKWFDLSKKEITIEQKTPNDIHNEVTI